MKNKYSLTIFSCFVGIFCQALVINYLPLLFVTFEKIYNIPIGKISFFITLTFSVQLSMDLLSTMFIDRLGHKFCACAAQFFSFFGLVLLGVLPDLMGDPFIAISLAILVYSLGAGLTEVIMSPIVEACPSKKKSAAMSLLHSFYCWGNLTVVLVSTLLFYLFGVQCWKIVSFVWAIIPFVNLIIFIKAPIPEISKGDKTKSVKELLKNKTFLIIAVIMISGGAAEQTLSQWASAFAETGLGVSKATGDLLGPCSFALCMGCARLFHGLYRGKVKLIVFMLVGGILTITGYVIAGLASDAIVGLVGCGLTGMAVGIMWPGTLSLASRSISGGGTAMFSLLALAGDIGCISGPAVVGFVADKAGNISTGILVSTLFAVMYTIGLLVYIFRFKGVKK